MPEPEHMTKNQFMFAVGNAMGGNVLTRLLASAIAAVYGPKIVADPWACPLHAARSILF